MTPPATPPTRSFFALPDRLAAKAAPDLVAADDAHFAAIADSLAATVADLTDRLTVTRRQDGRQGTKALERARGHDVGAHTGAVAVGVSALDDDVAARLRSAPLTYPPAVDGRAPIGFRTFEHHRRLPASVDLDRAVAALMTWQVQLRSGLRVAASDERIVEGTVCVLRFGPGPLAVTIPCRVLTVMAGDDVWGFTYGTLPGHPESGEESFTVHRSDAGLTMRIAAFARPASRLARLGGPATRAVQDVMTRRYLRALDD